ncbi:MAG: deoxyribose-phosphate aldolase [Clostridia bacterium]|nr:deoxyribose-phosphate aldolase [Clostridia bacterium]
MDIEKILRATDHTLLSQTATIEQIYSLCDEGIKFSTASVCIPLSYVKRAKEYVKDRLKICTVIGFPNGYSTENVKCFEATEAVALGADEIDMVINIGHVKNGDFDKVLHEIKAVKRAAGGKVLKVIIETCLLSEKEKIKMCEIVSKSGADFIKTSTGFSSKGATAEDIKLFAQHVEPHVKIKAAGGIASLEDAEMFLSLGASRLGTSRIIGLVKE